MISQAKKVLYIDLPRKQYEVRSFPEFGKYIGGVGLGLKVLEYYAEEDPVVFSVGPLNGFFPYASKTSIVFFSRGVVEDIYLGGSLSSRIRFSGVDAVVMTGRAQDPLVLDIHDDSVSFKPFEEETGALGLPGRRSVINLTERGALLDHFFEANSDFLSQKLVEKNIKTISFTGTKTVDIKNGEKYKKLVDELLDSFNDMKVEKGTNPSCSGCPMGCEKSKIGEIGGNVLVHSLVACTFAEEIYKNVGMVFSCLNVLGYDYTHEDIENLPKLVSAVLDDLSQPAGGMTKGQYYA